MEVKIYPINTGYIRLDKGAYITSKNYGEKVEVPTWSFLISIGKERILVDTGMSETKLADWHHPGSYQPKGYRIDEQLNKMGVGLEDVSTVILTHLHWDHCANMKLFWKAKFYVHSKELEFALNPHVLYLKSYDSKKLGATPPFENVEFEKVDGEYELNSYVKLFPTPGHSVGHQSVAVRTDKGTYVIAGDAIFADENLEPDREKNIPFTPMGRYTNIFEMFESMEKIVHMTDHVLTGHGMGVSQKNVYPD